MCKVIAISTNKGGVLKTSITVNLAGVLSNSGYKVLIVDADNQGNATMSFGVSPDNYKRTIYDVMVNGFSARSVIKNLYKSIDVLPSNDDMTFFEFDILPNISKIKNPFHLLKNALEDVREHYDYILIDSPPNLGLTQGNVLTASDGVIIPFQPETYSMRSLVKISQAIQSFKNDHNPNLKILGVIATLVDLRTVLHSDVLSECRKFCYENNIPMFDTVIPRLIRYASSIAYDNLPATLTVKNNELVKSYYDLKGEILNE